MGVPGSCAFVPDESMARYLAPSSVLIVICRVLSLPMKAFFTLKTTFTLSPSSVVEETVPTFTPAMRTSSLGRRFASSVK